MYNNVIKRLNVDFSAKIGRKLQTANKKATKFRKTGGICRQCRKNAVSLHLQLVPCLAPPPQVCVIA